VGSKRDHEEEMEEKLVVKGIETYLDADSWRVAIRVPRLKHLLRLLFNCGIMP
jgi:hypothetical protein